MSLFQYQAIDSQGKEVKGVLTAESFDVAKDIIGRKKLFLTGLKKKKGYEDKLRLSPSDLLGFTSSLAQLLKSGMPLHDCLIAVEEKFHDHKHHGLFLDLKEMVGNGRSLSYGLKKYPKIFDMIYVSLVESGEETATLPTIFKQLTVSLTKQNHLRKQAVSAMVYPAFLGGFCLVVVIGLFTFLIPSMRDLLEGRTLHPLTQAVLDFSQFMTAYWVSILVVCGGVIGGGVLWGMSQSGRRFFERIVVKLPIVGKLKLEGMLVRFCRSFAVLLHSGIPAHRAITLSGRVTNNKMCEAAIERVRDNVMQGGKISEEIAKIAFFPPIVSRMIATGEESGNMETMLFHLAEMYEEELEKSLSQLMSLLQPVMILLLGLIVGFVLLSVLLPLTDVSSFLN